MRTIVGSRWQVVAASVSLAAWTAFLLTMAIYG
jgi:hypothetical protein